MIFYAGARHDDGGPRIIYSQRVIPFLEKPSALSGHVPRLLLPNVWYAPNLKVLDEVFALEEMKRIELEQLEAQKKEQAKCMQREHEATKVVSCPIWSF